jgi:hypothetical protein
MQGRCQITNCQKIIQKLGFRKQESSGLTGLIIKTFLIRKTLGKDGKDSFWDTFQFLSKSEVANIVKSGAELWMTLKRIHMTASNRSSQMGEFPIVKNQFDAAHNLFIEKIMEHNQRENNLFMGALEILKGDSHPVGADGLSSQ